MKASTILVLIVLVCCAVTLTGCTSSQTTSSGSTPVAAGTASPTSTLTTMPTDVMPANIAVSVSVGEKDYLGNIPVTFNGGAGQGLVSSIQVVLTRVDGSTETQSLAPDTGTIVNLAGTRGSGSLEGQSDRVQVYVTMMNGSTYEIADVLREYRSRSGSGE